MTFAHPGWLVALLLLPLLVVGGILAARARAHRWSAFVSPRLRHALVRRANPLPRWISLVNLLAAFAALIVALCRPQGEGGSRTETVRGRNVMLAIDLSRSMLTPDVLPSRLDQAKALAYELLEKLPNDRLGVLAFAGTSFMIAPLTVDHAAVRETISQLDCETIPTGGSDLAGAVRAAIEAFGNQGRGRNALVILSDGEEHSGEIDAAAIEADRSGLFIVSIGIGTSDGAFVPDPKTPDNRFRDRDGNPVLSRLTAEPLRALASETGGQYVNANAGADVAALVENASGSLDRFEIATRKSTVLVEFYQWLVLPSILLLIAAIVAATNWRLPAVTATVAAFALTTPAKAADLQPEVVRNAAEAERTSGDTAARYRLAEGTAAFRGNELRRARGALSQALLATDPRVQAAAHHNLGNTLLESGWRTLSDGKPYPGDPEAASQLKALATAKIRAWLAADGEGKTPAPAFREFESVLVSWTDAVRHFDSAVAADASRDDSRHNRGVATRLLEKLRKALEQETESLEQQIPEPNPQPQEGEQNPQQGDQPQKQPEGQQGDQPPKPENQGQKPKDDKRPGQQGEQPQPEAQGDKGSEDKNKPQPGQGEKQREPTREDESPAERARRLLGENADLEQGPMIRNRRHEFVRPEKDW